jgi:prepilin-type N-terminal cleavage/methylation domain-containing protein
MTLALNNRGFTLIELVIVILVLGVLATIAVKNMVTPIETAKYEQTKEELDQLTFAIVGRPDVYAGGGRTDFGFVGDNGTLPASLDDLVQNPGGWSTWDGPYMEQGLNSDDFKKDAWNVSYSYMDSVIRSTGSGTDIDRLIASSTTELLSNRVEGYLRDADMAVPGATLSDSMVVLLDYPDGVGSTTTASTNVSSYGYFAFNSIPIGNHALKVVYLPDDDTVSYAITVYPGRNVRLDIVFPADLW